VLETPRAVLRRSSGCAAPESQRDIAPRTVELGRRCLAALAPPPVLTISEWAEENRVLPRSSPAAGEWKNQRAPFLVEPMDAFSDSRCKKIVLMLASGTGKTEILLNVVGYHVDYDPANILLVQPTVDRAREFSRDRLNPMFTDSPVFAGKVREARSRDSGNTLLRKEFPGGWIGLIGANAPSGLAGRHLRIVLADEIDRYPESAGTEGDPLRLAEVRQSNFWNRRTLFSSTPTVKGASRIDEAYEQSSREEWYVPCPSCGREQVYDWDRLVYERPESRERRAESLEGNGTDATDGTRKGTAPRPPPEKRGGRSGKQLSAEQRAAIAELSPSQRRAAVLAVTNERADDEPRMACERCGALHGEYEWKVRGGRWIAGADNPEVRGFKANALVSSFLSWRALVREYLDAVKEGDEALKVFWNTRLVRCWEQPGEELDEGLLQQRRHEYGCDVPAGVSFLTAGVDVHPNRIEMEVVGWGAGKESWGIQYQIIFGDPQRAGVWHELDECLQRTYVRSDGAVMAIQCAGVDQGHATSQVYGFTRPRVSRYVFAVKGIGGPGKPIVGPATRQGKNKNVWMFPVGTDASKDALLAQLQVEMEGPGYCHFPREETLSDGGLRGYNEDYFRGLMSEKRVAVQAGGRMVHVWRKRSGTVHNEPLDARVYARAGLEIRNPDLAAIGGGGKEAESRGQRAESRRGGGRRVVRKGGVW
jgi:phage terminase large subunit GpA-like protein